MLNYIWLNDDKPILRQVHKYFSSCFIILNPFIQMPEGWTNDKKSNNPNTHIYPSHDEIISIAKPVAWESVLQNTGLKTYEELALALKSSIGALRIEYARNDLSDVLVNRIPNDLYYPNEDGISEFIAPSMFECLSKSGAQRLYFSDPIRDKCGYVKICNFNLRDIKDLSTSEVLIIDENMEYAFLSVYDSFINVFLCKTDGIEGIIKEMNWEGIICSKNTYINWYSKGRR